MVARIAGFRTRSQLKLRAPRSRSTNITPQNGGAAIHWGGPRQSLGNHAQCENIWRSWQNYHMNTHNWVDIAYTAAFCNHGYVLAGRGYGTRTAANGTNTGNQNYYAFVWIGGSGNTITQDAINALEWLIRDARSKGAGRRVRPHQAFTGSACPGNTLINHSNRLNNSNISDGGNTPAKEDDMPAPKDWDNKDKEVFQALINNMVVKNTELNLAWHLRYYHRAHQATLDALNAVTKVVEDHAKRGGVDSEQIAREVADNLGENLDALASEIGKSAAEITAEDIIRKHGQALLDGVGDD